MKILLIIVFIGALIESHQPKCIIVPGKGLNEIQVGKSFLKDVLKEFGSNRIKRKWHKAVEVDLFGHFEYYIFYQNIGVFSTYTVKYRNKDTLKTITMVSPCRCRTGTGLGIGSSYSDIIAELGPPKIIYNFVNQNNTERTKIVYDNMDIELTSNDTINGNIYKIEIYDSK